MRLSWLLALILGFTPGCSDDPDTLPTSADFEPSQISLLAEFETNGGTAQILVLVSGDGYPATLGGNDALLVSVPGEPETHLAAAGLQYVTQLETTSTEVDLVFARGETRFVSHIAAPPPFALSGPSAPASRAAPIPVTWDTGVGTYETWLEVASSCLAWPITRHFTEDIGAFEIQPADLEVLSNTNDCDFRVWVTRSASGGQIAAGLATSPAPGGRQIRSIVIPTLP